MGSLTTFVHPGLRIVCISCDETMSYHPPIGDTTEVRTAKSCCSKCMEHHNLA